MLCTGVKGINQKIEDEVMFCPGGSAADKERSEDFCRMRGYDIGTGWPTKEVLEKLGLKDVADKLYAISGEK